MAEDKGAILFQWAQARIDIHQIVAAKVRRTAGVVPKEAPPDRGDRPITIGVGEGGCITSHNAVIETK